MKFYKSLTVLLAIFLSINYYAQNKVTVQLNVFEPLPEISFAAFLTNPFLEGTPRIFQVRMEPQGQEVIIHGTILWRRINENSEKELYSFTTKPFKSQNFYNDEFSSYSGIEIDEQDKDDDLLEENLKNGNPTGTYRIIVKLMMADNPGAVVSEDEKELNFLNPTQTISIIQPSPMDILDVGGIQVTWTSVTGVERYLIKASVRKSKFESLEEALQNGNPLVDNKDVGTNTSVNLRDYLNRELVGGEEIVVQVHGTIPSPGGEKIVYSDIVNFLLRSEKTPVVDKGIKDIETMLISALDDLKSSGSGDSDVYEKLNTLLENIRNGNISFNNIRIRAGNGSNISYAEFQEILLYLRRNPDQIVNLTFEEK